jgi:mycothiol synthase
VTALPQLPGVDFRPFRGEADYPEFARIINAHSKAEDDDRVETSEGIASGYAHLDNCDPVHDVVVAEVEGVPVGYTRVWWGQEPNGPRIYDMVCLTDPVYRGRGIGTALVEWDMARIRAIAAGHDDANDKLYETWLNDKNVSANDLIRRAGFEPVTYAAQMIRATVDDLPDHVLPDGLEIRPVRGEDIRTIWEADIEAFRDHWGFTEPTEESYERFLAFPYNDPTLWKIAWDAEGVAGQVKSFIDTAQNEEYSLKRGWTEAISTSRRWRRKGVAKALIVESIRELASRGITEVALGVHTENPNGAYQLYESLGYEVVRTWTTYRKPL